MRTGTLERSDCLFTKGLNAYALRVTMVRQAPAAASYTAQAQGADRHPDPNDSSQAYLQGDGILPSSLAQKDPVPSPGF